MSHLQHMKYEIPLTGQTVDTNDGAGGVARDVGMAVAGFVTLFGVTGAAAFLYNRAKRAAGVEANQQIPGV